MKFCKFLKVLPFLNDPINLDPSYKMDLDFWDCFGRKKKNLCLIAEEILYVLFLLVTVKTKTDVPGGLTPTSLDL